MSCAEHAVHQTKNDEPRWGPDGGQKHVTRPKAQALRAPRLNDSPSLSLSFDEHRVRVCVCNVCAARLRRVHPRVSRASRYDERDSAIVRARDVEKRNLDNRIYIYIYNHS